MVPLMFSEAVFGLVEGLQDALFTGIRRLTSIRIEPYKPFVSEDGVAAIKRYLQSKQPERWFSSRLEA